MVNKLRGQQEDPTTLGWRVKGGQVVLEPRSEGYLTEARTVAMCPVKAGAMEET